MPSLALIELLVAGLLLWGALLPDVLRSRPPRPDLVTGLLVALPLLALLVPTTLISLSDNVAAIRIDDNNLLTLAAGAPSAVALGLLGLLGALHLRASVPAGLLIAAQCTLAAVIAVVSGQGWIQPALAVGLALLAVFTATRLDGSRSLQWGAQVAVMLLVLGLAIAVTIDPAHFLGACRADKCSLAGAVIVQGLSGNNLGIFVATFSPLALIGLRARRFVPAAVGLGLLVDLTSARAALLGFAATVVVLGLRHIRPLRRSRIAALVTLAACVAVALLPLYNSWDESAFTSRGQLWARAKELVTERPLFGWGPAYWTGQPASPNFPNYGPHSAALEVLVSTGVVGLLLVLGAFFWMVLRAGDRGFDVVALVTPILVTGALESTLATQRFTILFGFLPVFIALVYAAQVSARGRGRHARARPSPESLAASSR